MRFLKTSIAAALVGFGTVAASPAWAISNSIESIIGSQQGEATQVRIRMGMPLTEVPPSFSLANPHRLALDFKDTDNRIGRSLVEIAGGDVKSVNVVQSGERSRVVLNMSRPMRFQTEIDGNDLILSLNRQDTVVGAPVKSGPLPMVAQNARGSAHALKDIDFRRGKDGEGRVVIDLSDDGAGVDVRQQGKNLIVEFQGTSLPANLRRQLDVADFGTPIKTVRTQYQSGNTRLIIEPQGLWEHSAYQSDSQFVVEVKPVKEDPNRLTQGSRPGYRGERLSLNFQNVDVRALLQVIADFTNLNIVTSDTVQGKLTLRLKDVPWDQALDIIMQSRGLDMRKNGNVVMIAPREELATKEKLTLESKQQIAEIEPLRTETFTLNYQTAEKIRDMLTDEKQSVLSKRGSALADIRSNKLFVMDTPSRLDEVRQMIAQIDIPVRQVLIEARIVEADDRFSRNLGTKLGYYDRRSTMYRTVSRPNPVTGEAEAYNVPVYGPGSKLGRVGYGTISGNLSGSADLSAQLGGEESGAAVGLGKATDLANTNFFSFPAGGINGTNPASLAISLFGSSLSRFINLELSALEADQRGKVVSSPRVLTSSQRPAVIEQGTELPYQSATSSGATSVSFRKANLRLEVTPQITPEGNVILDVDVSRDAVGQLTNAGYAIDTRHVKTQVLVEDGGTVVIGGIYEQYERNRTDKVPLLGDIPILGYLFRSTSRSNDRTELLVFLTPRIVTDKLAQR
ncbi:type IV pilus secretin PilQ [Lautropia dentalis]|uniref:Type IV pilus biogenesis and competence protein PilQ n=1 Tax=Lautropia dentalis TaxID=2490857 RepID=A0A3R8NQG7_9BURK|nr:type IV pilus secretin PilQ [Lautropia dentalis]RRN43520.1 type IV pilus secretin PilQ [Lautropia dentalis]